MLWEFLTVALGITSGVLIYFLREKASELATLVEQRNYYYKLALSYYNTNVQMDTELKTAKRRAVELERRVKFFENQLASVVRERKEIEKMFKELLRSNKRMERKINSVAKLSKALAKLDELQRQLERLANTLENELSEDGKRVLRMTVMEREKVEELKATIEDMIDKLLTVSKNVEDYTDNYLKFFDESRKRVVKAVNRLENEIDKYSEGLENIVTKTIDRVREEKEYYRTARIESGRILENFGLVVSLFNSSGRIKVSPKDVYHVGGYAPFDYIIVLRDPGRRRIKGIVFVEMKTGYLNLSDYEYDFAKKVIGMKSNFFKYGILHLYKGKDNGGCWKAEVYIIESIDELNRYIESWDYSSKR